MKKILENELPVLSGENAEGRAKVAVTLDALKGFGNAIGGYSARINDVIEFPDSEAEAQIFTQPVRPNSEAKQRLVVVLRNGHPSYFSLGCLSRRDKDGNPAKNDFAREMNDFDSDASRLAHLFGKKIRCKAIEQIETYVFDNQTMSVDRSKTTTQNVPVFEYVA